MDNDDITFELSDILTNITIGNSPQNGDIYIDTSTMDTKVYTTASSWTSIGDLTIDTIDLGNITITPVEFEDNMPSVAKVEDMCNEYPALQIAYENFKTIYKMVHQDWVGKQKEDELPF
jgi:hypothetical protein